MIFPLNCEINSSGILRRNPAKTIKSILLLFNLFTNLLVLAKSNFLKVKSGIL